MRRHTHCQPSMLCRTFLDRLSHWSRYRETSYCIDRCCLLPGNNSLRLLVVSPFYDPLLLGTKSVAVAKMANHTAYNVRYSCRTEPPKNATSVIGMVICMTSDTDRAMVIPDVEILVVRFLADCTPLYICCLD